MRNYWAMVGEGTDPVSWTAKDLDPRRPQKFFSTWAAVIETDVPNIIDLAPSRFFRLIAFRRQPSSEDGPSFYAACIATFRGVMQKRHHVDDFSHLKGYSSVEYACLL